MEKATTRKARKKREGRRQLGGRNGRKKREGHEERKGEW